jgi:hypothetical protein
METELHDLDAGHAKTSELKVQYDLLASAIPAMSYSMAVNPMPGMADNIDMQSLKTDASKWPSEKHESNESSGRWLHSDVREVAFCYLYKMYEKMINLGNLNQ